MRESLRIAADLGLPLPRNPMTLADAARLAMSWSEALSRRDEERAALGRGPVTCGKGCAACCRELVPVSPAEAFALREGMDALSPEASAARRSRFDEAIGTLLRAAAEYPGLAHDPARYFGLYLACPFLDEETCSIHPGRPLACREHLAVSPAALCRSFPHPSIRMLVLSHPAGEALSRACGELLGRAPERIPLVSALAWADGHPADGKRVWPAERVAGVLATQLFSR